MLLQHSPTTAYTKPSTIEEIQDFSFVSIHTPPQNGCMDSCVCLTPHRNTSVAPWYPITCCSCMSKSCGETVLRRLKCGETRKHAASLYKNMMFLAQYDLYLHFDQCATPTGQGPQANKNLVLLVAPIERAYNTRFGRARRVIRRESGSAIGLLSISFIS